MIEIAAGVTFNPCLWQGDKGLPGSSGEKGNPGRRVGVFPQCCYYGKNINISFRE